MSQAQISLSEQEVGVILSLLRQEQDELPVEMHHTDSAHYREGLHNRQELIHELIARLEQYPSTLAP